jgi:hypothetical protein
MARWIVSPENPLTSRVLVNRFWEVIFGVGIVRTSEEFGAQGEMPVHPDLLDWLATEFIRTGWDTKGFLKLLVTSAAYQQSSVVTPETQEKDPENRFLARGPRFRSSAEVLRDQALFVSGLMKEQLGGPSVKPYQPEGIWEEATFGKKTYQQDHGDALYRRSLYTFWRRTVSPANMFDTANRQTCAVRASRTSTPLHALTTLNDPTWVEAARVLAEKSMKAAADADGRLQHAFRRILGRKPTRYDLETLGRMHGRQLAVYRADAEAAKHFLGVGESPRNESLDVAEHAALTSVCLAIFNLDEALTRE